MIEAVPFYCRPLLQVAPLVDLFHSKPFNFANCTSLYALVWMIRFRSKKAKALWQAIFPHLWLFYFWFFSVTYQSRFSFDSGSFSARGKEWLAWSVVAQHSAYCTSSVLIFLDSGITVESNLQTKHSKWGFIVMVRTLVSFSDAAERRTVSFYTSFSNWFL